MEFLRAGGVASLVILVLGVLGLAVAARFAVRPDPRRVEVLRAFTVAIVFSVGAGMAAGITAVFTYLPTHPAQDGAVSTTILLQGVAEVMTIPTLGFGMLTATWLMVSLGLRRLAATL